MRKGLNCTWHAKAEFTYAVLSLRKKVPKCKRAATRKGSYYGNNVRQALWFRSTSNSSTQFCRENVKLRWSNTSGESLISSTLTARLNESCTIHFAMPYHLKHLV
jgi:hypothetical protein